jgi:hypothetical protein
MIHKEFEKLSRPAVESFLLLYQELHMEDAGYFWDKPKECSALKERLFAVQIAIIFHRFFRRLDFFQVKIVKILQIIVYVKSDFR